MKNVQMAIFVAKGQVHADLCPRLFGVWCCGFTKFDGAVVRHNRRAIYSEFVV